MEAATMEIVQGVTLEAISAPDLPDTESLLGELGSMYPVVTYPAAETPVEEEWDDRGDAAGANGPAPGRARRDHHGRLAVAVDDTV
jgi:hypothetical protein